MGRYEEDGVAKNLVEIEVVDPGEGILRRWSDADKESAYFLWRTTAGRNLTLVSKITAIPYNTLDSWKRNNEWRTRADDEEREMRMMPGNAVALVIHNQALPSIMTAVEIRDDRNNQAKDRLNAAIWLGGLAGHVPAQRSQLEIHSKRAAVEARSYEALTDDEFKERILAFAKEVGDQDDGPVGMVPDRVPDRDGDDPPVDPTSR